MRVNTLLNQVLAVNVLLVATSIASATLIVMGGADETNVGTGLLVCLAGLCVVLLNSILVRRRLAPLELLVELMSVADLDEPEPHPVEVGGSAPLEVIRLGEALNTMLTRLQLERRESGNAVLRAQENERGRIARDLHDEVNQALTAILLRLQATLEHSPEALQEELVETKGLVNRAMGELLAIAHQLRPTALDDLGLIAALRSQVAEFDRIDGVEADLRVRGELPALSTEQQLVIYRVVQEGLSNVAQHAAAARVEVELLFGEGTIVRVRDDGAGFPDTEPTRPGGLGLSGMRERALLVGGRLDIRSRPSKGTTVELSLPA